MEGIRTGIDFLDSGADGFYRGKPYLVFGGSGTGKSIFGLQFAHAAMERGESVLYICREKADDLIQQGERLGFPLTQGVDDDQLVLLEYDEGFRDIVTRAGPEAVLVELEAEVADLGIRRVVLDPVAPFFSTMDDESVLRHELRQLTSRFEELDWTPLLLCDREIQESPFALRVFSEVCWGLFELQRATDEARGPDHQLLVYKLRNAELAQSKFGFRIGEGGIRGGDGSVVGEGRRSFARFKRPAAEPRPPAARPAPAPVAPPPAAIPAAPAPRAEAPRTASPDELDLLDDSDLDELERRLRGRRFSAEGSAPQEAPAKVRPAFEAPAGFELGTRPVRAEPAARPRVLVIEGDHEARVDLVAAASVHADVLDAEDGVAGLRKAAEEKPDLVVMGARMPRLNGIGLCRIFREHGIEIPLVLLCASHAGPGEGPRSLAAGADAFLTKPVAPQALRSEIARLLLDVQPGAAAWPAIDVGSAVQCLVPRDLAAGELEREVATARAFGEDAGVAISLIGYEFRFVEGKGREFVDRFDATLRDHVRAEDGVCRLSDKRLAVLLVDADETGARSVIQRVHQEMAGLAGDFLAAQLVKPKALYRVLTLQPHQLTEERIEPPYVDRLFEETPRLIEQDLDDRPGEPIEKYPLIEAIYHALTGDLSLVTSPLDGGVHEIQGHGAGRYVDIEDHRYGLQDPDDESPAGFRARSGASILWVHSRSKDEPVARVEDGRVFRGNEA